MKTSLELMGLACSTSCLILNEVLPTRFLPFSRWTSLVKGVSRLTQLAQKLQSRTAAKETEDKASIVEVRRRAAQMLIISNVQSESFQDDTQCLKIGKKLPKSSPLTSLKPIIDPEGILRVGDRLHYADTPQNITSSNYSLEIATTK